MENATKALLIAGEILITILLVTLLIFAWGKYQEYQRFQEELAETEDTTNFNNEYVNYDREDVQGYELLSLVNQTIDYNERSTVTTTHGNNERYSTSMTVKIDMTGTDITEFTYNGTNKLFENKTYVVNERKSEK